MDTQTNTQLNTPPVNTSPDTKPGTRKIIIGVIAVVIVGVALGWVYFRGGRARIFDGSASNPPVLAQGSVEWGFFLIPQIGNPLDGLKSVSWSRLTGLWWGRIQKPDGTYTWSELDGQVQKAQQGGYNLIAELKTGNNNVISDQTCYQALLKTAKSNEGFAKELALHSCPLKPEYIPRWKTFVRDVIERYDGDGNKDMPGLEPGFVMDIEIENEPGNSYYWHYGENDGKKAAKSLLTILKPAVEARNEANPGTRILLAGLIHSDVLMRCESDPQYDSRCSEQYFVRNRAFTEEILKYPQYFDAIDVHFFNYFKFDPYNIGDGMKWLRARTAANGYSKPIYVLEWTGSIMMAVTNEGHTQEFAEYFPYVQELGSTEAFSAVYRNLAAPENTKYRVWFETEQAREFPKLFTTMLANGVRRMVYVRFSDYTGTGWNNTWWNWQGIVRYTGTVSNPVLVKKPAYYTYQLLEEKLRGFENVTTLDLGQNIFAYRFSFKNEPPVIVAWTEGKPATVDLSSAMSGSVAVTHIVTELNANNVPIRLPNENAPASAVPVTDTPVFVQAVGQ